MKNLHPAVRGAALSEFATRLFGEPRRFGARHYAEFERWLATDSASCGLALPGRLRVSRASSVLEFMLESDEIGGMHVAGETHVFPPGRAHFPDSGLLLFAAFANKRPRMADRIPGKRLVMTEHVDFGEVEGSLVLRHWRHGDGFRPLGMRGNQKLKKFYASLGIGGDQRLGHPVVADGKGIVWVVGLRIAERVKLTAGTRRILKLCAARTEANAGEAV